MQLDPNQYFGTTTQSLRTESFNISLTDHSTDSQISLHAHDKPYFCLLISGLYEEKGEATDVITQGEVVYRSANYEHSNSFSNQGGVCLNIEVNDQDRFMTFNDVQLPNNASKQKGSVEVFKLLYSLKRGLPLDVLDINCYESMVAVVNGINAQGDIAWIKKVKDLIHDNPMASISLDGLSLEFSLHPNYIVRKFKEVTGFKLSEYLTRVRLEHSINHLLASDEKMVSVAIENGFYDQSHFNRNFKKYLDATPNQFKKVVVG